MDYITDVWGLSILFWGIGLFFGYATYIGAPIKWLALICFADISITMLPFFLIREHIKKKD